MFSSIQLLSLIFYSNTHNCSLCMLIDNWQLKENQDYLTFPKFPTPHSAGTWHLLHLWSISDKTFLITFPCFFPKFRIPPLEQHIKKWHCFWVRDYGEKREREREGRKGKEGKEAREGGREGRKEGEQEGGRKEIRRPLLRRAFHSEILKLSNNASETKPEWRCNEQNNIVMQRGW